MPNTAFSGLPHSESEVYCGKVRTIGLTPLRSRDSFPVTEVSFPALLKRVARCGAKCRRDSQKSRSGFSLNSDTICQSAWIQYFLCRVIRIQSRRHSLSDEVCFLARAEFIIHQQRGELITRRVMSTLSEPPATPTVMQLN